MAPQTRGVIFPVVFERESDTEESSDEEEEDNADDSDDDVRYDAVEEQKGEASTSADARRKPITLSLKKVCKVCKKPGHQAGFKGATYIDCPMKPCFLCKLPGHTTMTCPHRVVMEYGVAPAPLKSSHNSVGFVFERQISSRVSAIKPAFVIPNKVNCAVIRYHSRRVTCLEFHPTNNILLSGDKKGQLGVWDYKKVHEKTVYRDIHGCILNNMKFNPSSDGTVYGASSDGTISCTDLETEVSSTLVNLNPNGWQGPSRWRMLYGLDVNPEKSVLLAADNFGFLHMIDMRSNVVIGKPVLVHKRGSKVTGLHCHPLQPDILLTCGNDHFVYLPIIYSNLSKCHSLLKKKRNMFLNFREKSAAQILLSDSFQARIWDMRLIESESSIYNLPHKRVVNSAYFSPHTGSKILTTSQDNRLRIWDSIFGNMDSPSREIVHSHDFNRHLTPFKAEWDPKDVSESLVVVGRYISENFEGIALHPIDFIEASKGQLVAEVMDPNITTISPVNKLHPRDDVLASGSSRSIFIWKPQVDDDSNGEEKKEWNREGRIVIGSGMRKKQRKGKYGDDSDDDFDDDGFKSLKRQKCKIKTKAYYGSKRRQ